MDSPGPSPPCLLELVQYVHEVGHRHDSWPTVAVHGSVHSQDPVKVQIPIKGFHQPQTCKLCFGHLLYSSTDIKKDVFLNFAGAYLSATPLTHLVAFVVVPAHRQIVFIEGVDLAETIFFHTLVRVFATWAVKTNFVQTMMKNVTDSVQSAQTRRLRQERMERYYRAKDEI